MPRTYPGGQKAREEVAFSRESVLVGTCIRATEDKRDKDEGTRPQNSSTALMMTAWILVDGVPAMCRAPWAQDTSCRRASS